MTDHQQKEALTIDYQQKGTLTTGCNQMVHSPLISSKRGHALLTFDEKGQLKAKKKREVITDHQQKGAPTTNHQRKGILTSWWQ